MKVLFDRSSSLTECRNLGIMSRDIESLVKLWKAKLKRPKKILRKFWNLLRKKSFVGKIIKQVFIR